MHNVKPLTGLGGAYEINKPLREKLVLLSDGTMIINENYKHDSQVLNKIVLFKNTIGYDGKSIVDNIRYDDPDKIRGYYQEDSRCAFIDKATAIQKDIADLIDVAYHKRSTDIHIVLDSPSTFILFRILGDLHVHKVLTYDEGNLMCTTLYNTMTTTSGTNFNSRTQQDANIQESFLPQNISGIRVATGPMQSGNYFMVLRLLPNGSNNKLDRLGYSKSQLKMLREFKSTHNGGITICSGPTGSGKSTLLQALTVEILSDYKGTINLITIEDPVEYPIVATETIGDKIFTYKARQIAIASTQDKELRHNSFNNAIISAMRQDPDVIMIGEIRDAITANTAITASLTGHPVLTTVHASNALMILDRLTTIGANKKLLLSPGIITGFVSQHLIPVLCPQCKVSITKAVGNKITKYHHLGITDRLNQVFAYDLDGIYIKGDGCDFYDATNHNRCINGYVNRTVVAEVIVPCETFMQYLRDDDLSGATRYWLDEMGGINMMCHALAKVKTGVIDPFALESKLKYISPQPNLDIAIDDC